MSITIAIDRESSANLRLVFNSIYSSLLRLINERSEAKLIKRVLDALHRENKRSALG